MTIVSLPDSLISTLPGSYYTDATIFAMEQADIFESMWFCAVRSADLDKPGAFKTVQVGRESVLITRSRSGEVRAFFNVCRHRGAQLCTDESGEVKRAFQCPYHAWTYDLDGKLVAAPNLTKMPDIDRVEYGLHRIAVQEWLGYVWVCLADDAAVVRRHGAQGRQRSTRQRRIDRPLRRRAPARRSPDSLRRQGELEAHHRELHGVLPLRHDPSGTDRGAARVRRRVGGAVPRRAWSRIRRAHRGIHHRRLGGARPDPERRRRPGPALLRDHDHSRRCSSTWCPTT